MLANHTHPTLTSPRGRPWASALAVACLLLVAGPISSVMAETPATVEDQAPGPSGKMPDPAATDTGSPVAVEVDHAKMVTLPAAATTVFVANPEMADVQVPTTTSFLLLGKKTGTTTAYAVLSTGRTMKYAVTVQRSLSGLLGAMQREVPTADVTVGGAPRGVTISGTVESPMDIYKLKSLARQYAGEKEDVAVNVTVREAVQVSLHVRVAEVSREATKQFGFNWSAIFNNGSFAFGLLTGRTPVTSFGNFIPSPAVTDIPDSIGFGYHGSNANISTLIDALAQEGLVTVLAEPNLTALSGETANFLAGGEFPIPVSSFQNEVTIQFKKYGVSIDFTPVVLDGNRMSIKVAPEVSELTSTGAIILNNIQIPALTVRRAKTTVELASGESFAIAGLFQNDVTSVQGAVPWLGDVPVLGALFRSDKFKRKESELVIIVTPYVVHPAKRPGDLRMPTDGLVFGNDLERILMGRTTVNINEAAPNLSPTPETPHLHGPAGFIVE